MNSNILLTLLLLTMVRAASKYYDGPIRPYEFGFNIEGHQHRKESKDKNGIIMGEFGFITADNVYHVTVYATDEDGNFKIVSMKNYKLGPTMPTASPPSAAPTRPTTKAVPTATSTSTTPQPFRIITTVKTVEPLTTPKPSNIASCSGCKIPTPPRTTTTTTEAPLPETSTQYVPPFKIVNKNDLEADGKPTTTTTTMMAITTTTPQSSGSSKEVPQKLIEKAPPTMTTTTKERPGSGASKVTNNNRNNNSNNEPTKERDETRKGMQRPASGANRVNEETPQLNEGSRPAAKDGDPVMKLVELHTANMIQHILNGLLYRFNYTAGYHGHHEQGDRQGNKEGGYFAVGRDGIRRGVSYKANEFGFQPHVKFEKVSPEETPREETEKQAGLKGFDFKWFYGS
ncbi:protein lethal(3)malignant blood neoplasm 1 [Anopheles aquasalis]|uniref:protein lethal(3)malignant blood neoplasm 1 n=1 Tax=Anopheles aquasalis TaxID=42839 RepID=UPI00215A9C6E|nr:protein lethal(3)malignant blood neoplasm 1 [Anopheles aquasalis]